VRPLPGRMYGAMNLPELIEGRLIKRYQRFLADVRLAGGGTVTAHCPNTGSMLGVSTPGSRVWLSRSDNPKRRLAYTWELVETGPGVLVGIHTGRSNALVREGLERGALPELAGFHSLRAEARLSPHSRTDWLLAYPDGVCYLEVKNVTAAVQDGVGFFPDAVSVRAVKHLEELSERVAAGERAALVFCVQRDDVMAVHPADHIDPAFGGALRAAARRGVELYALGAAVTQDSICMDRRLEVRLESS